MMNARTLRIKTLTDEFSPQRLNILAWAVSAGTADPADVRRVLEQFYRLALSNHPIPDRLTAFVAEAFGRYLGHKGFYGPGERSADSLDSAFGVLRKQGHPPADEQRRIKMAAAVLRHRLTGTRHQQALKAAAAECASNTATVGEAWAEYWDTAIAAISSERSPGTYPWTESEARILHKIQKERRRHAVTHRETPDINLCE